MTPFERLLVPLDLSDEADQALTPALALAERVGARVTLFSWSFDEGETAAAKRYLLGMAGTLGGTVDVDAVTTDDPGPAPALAAAAGTVPGTVICMATHGRSGVGHALLGSVAEATLRLARHPLVLVGPHAGGRALAHAGKLVACVDGSELSETVLPVAHDWSRGLGMPLHLLQVVALSAAHGMGPGLPDLVESGYLAGLAGRLGADGGKGLPDYDVMHGDPTRSIASYAVGRAALLAVATHGRGGLSRAVMGSVAMRTVHRALCPVLVVPAGRRT